MTKLKLLLCALLFTSIAQMAEAQFITSKSATPSAMSATIAWTTCAAGTSKVRYGRYSAYSAAVTLNPLVTSHSVPLTGLKENTTYHYQVVSTDASGQSVGSPDGTFTTTGTQAHTVSMTWTAGATIPAGHTVSYSVYRGTGACPQNSTRIVQSLASASYTDSSALTNGTSYCYQVTETDTSSGNGKESAKSTGSTAVIP